MQLAFYASQYSGYPDDESEIRANQYVRENRFPTRDPTDPEKCYHRTSVVLTPPPSHAKLRKNAIKGHPLS